MQHVSRRVSLAAATGTMVAAGGLFANENASARFSTFRGFDSFSATLLP